MSGSVQICTDSQGEFNMGYKNTSRIQNFASYKSFLEFYLVYKNVCLKFPRPILKKFEKANSRKLTFEFFRKLSSLE